MRQDIALLAVETHERALVTGLEDRRLGGRHDAVRARVGWKGAQVVLRVDPDRVVWADDERPYVEARTDSDRSPDNEGHRMGGRHLDERGQTWITLREG